MEGGRGAERGWLRRIGHWFRSEKALELPPPKGRSLSRWALLGALIGVAAGFGAIAFYWMLEHATQFFLGTLAGFHPAAPAGEGNHPASAIGRPWIMPLVVAAGGLLSGLLVFLFAPEAEGHGTDAAIEAFHHKDGVVRARIIPVKALASALMIGAGGSGGREGPVAQISSGVGSLLGRALKLESTERRILLAAGIGAGIGAIFRAPLGGAVLSAQILYTDDLEVEALFPGLIASIVGYSIFGSWVGWSPIFGGQPSLAFDNPLQLIHYAVLGLVCGAVGRAYVGAFYGLSALSRRAPLPAWLKPALGGLLVGLLGLALPGVIGTGYGSLQELMTARVAELPLWILLALPFAKILATSLSIGTGGSGGIFGPGMVIGGAVGVALWRLGRGSIPGMPDSPAPFAIVAMMALFGSIAHARLAVMLMVAEMTGNLSLLAPAMVAIGAATLVVGETTIYRSQLRTRADSPAHRLDAAFPLLQALTVRDSMIPPALVLPPSMSLSDAQLLLERKGLDGAPVAGRDRRLMGVLSAAAAAKVEPERLAASSVEEVMQPAPVTLQQENTLAQAMEAMAEARATWAIVVRGIGLEVIGILGMAQIVEGYRAGQRRSLSDLRSAAAHSSRQQAQEALAGGGTTSHETL